MQASSPIIALFCGWLAACTLAREGVARCAACTHPLFALFCEMASARCASAELTVSCFAEPILA